MGFRSSSQVCEHFDPHSVYSALGSSHVEFLHSDSGTHELFDWLFKRIKPFWHTQPDIHCLVQDWNLAVQVSGHADPHGLKTSFLGQEHWERGTHLLLWSVSRTYPFLQKQPKTHWSVQTWGVKVQFSWQALPHWVYSSFSGHWICFETKE
jgi:hypothetical protein